MAAPTTNRLLRLDDRDRRGLEWVRNRARFWITVLKRKRKYGLPRGAEFDPAEDDRLRSLLDLEQAAERLLQEEAHEEDKLCQEDDRQN